MSTFGKAIIIAVYCLMALVLAKVRPWLVVDPPVPTYQLDWLLNALFWVLFLLLPAVFLWLGLTSACEQWTRNREIRQGTAKEADDKTYRAEVRVVLSCYVCSGPDSYSSRREGNTDHITTRWTEYNSRQPLLFPRPAAGKDESQQHCGVCGKTWSCQILGAETEERTLRGRRRRALVVVPLSLAGLCCSLLFWQTHFLLALIVNSFLAGVLATFLEGLVRRRLYLSEVISITQDTRGEAMTAKEALRRGLLTQEQYKALKHVSESAGSSPHEPPAKQHAIEAPGAITMRSTGRR